MLLKFSLPLGRYRLFAWVLPLWLALQCCGGYSLAQSNDPPVGSEDKVEKQETAFNTEALDPVWECALPPDARLPSWAATYAKALPKTTAAMLRLDDYHRRHSPLGNRLAGLLRWQVATSLESPYALAYARHDLLATGMTEQQFDELSAGELELSDQQQRCLRFASKLTTAGYTITDQETAALISAVGEQDMVGIVQTIAFANFQFRLMIAVDSQIEEDEPLDSYSPFKWNQETELPTRKSLDDLYLAEPVQEYNAPASFTEGSIERLTPSMQQQKERSSRIQIPDPDRVARLDQEDQESANRITWSRVAYGYQPEMTRLWFQCLRAYQREAKPDSFFLNSVFWVVTRSNECFY